MTGDGAARVCFTLDELAANLTLPPGCRIEAAEPMPSGHRPGIALVVSGPGLPPHHANNPLQVLTPDAFWRRLVAPRDRHNEDHQSERGYQPVTSPVAPSDTVVWPRFPGEDQHHEALRRPVTSAPTDELDPSHFGGPR